MDDIVSGGGVVKGGQIMKISGFGAIAICNRLQIKNVGAMWYNNSL